MALKPMPDNNMPYSIILGTRVNMVQINAVLNCMEGWIKNGDKGRFVVVSNLHAIMEGRRRPEFQKLLNTADLFVPDGVSTLFIGRQRGFQLKERVTGTELMTSFCSLSNQKHYSSYFYGDTDEVLNTMKSKLNATYPGMEISGAYSPPFRPLTQEEDEAVVKMINEAKPDVLWVGLGCPKQEQWVYDHKDRLDVPIIIGVGAAFKFLSGHVQRAPKWARNFHLEWLWRLMQEPKRIWRRVLVDGSAYFYLTFFETLRLKKSNQQAL